MLERIMNPSKDTKLFEITWSLGDYFLEDELCKKLHHHSNALYVSIRFTHPRIHYWLFFI